MLRTCGFSFSQHEGLVFGCIIEILLLKSALTKFLEVLKSNQCFKIVFENIVPNFFFNAVNFLLYSLLFSKIFEIGIGPIIVKQFINDFSE